MMLKIFLEFSKSLIFLTLFFLFIACGNPDTLFFNRKPTRIEILAKPEKPKILPLENIFSKKLNIDAEIAHSLDKCHVSEKFSYDRCAILSRVISTFHAKYLQGVDYHVDMDCAFKEKHSFRNKEKYQMDFSFVRQGHKISLRAIGELENKTSVGTGNFKEGRIEALQQTFYVQRFLDGKPRAWDPLAEKRILHRYISHLEVTLQHYLNRTSFLEI